MQSRKLLRKGDLRHHPLLQPHGLPGRPRLGGGTHREYLNQTDAAYSPLGRLWRKIRPKERLELELERAGFLPHASKAIVAVSIA
jgi:hypothetical protein